MFISIACALCCLCNVWTSTLSSSSACLIIKQNSSFTKRSLFLVSKVFYVVRWPGFHYETLYPIIFLVVFPVRLRFAKNLVKILEGKIQTKLIKTWNRFWIDSVSRKVFLQKRQHSFKCFLFALFTSNERKLVVSIDRYVDSGNLEEIFDAVFEGPVSGRSSFQQLQQCFEVMCSGVLHDKVF